MEWFEHYALVLTRSALQTTKTNKISWAVPQEAHLGPLVTAVKAELFCVG